MGGVALGFVLLVWTSAAGSVSALKVPTVGVPRARPVPPPVPSATPTPTATGTATHHAAAHTFDSVWQLLATAILVAVGVALLLLLWAVWQWWRDRVHTREPVPPAMDFAPVPDIAQALTATVARQRDALAEGSVRNAIVACWLALEESAAAAGLPRDPAETAAEFTTRVVESYTVDRSAIATLAALYREARFSSHVLGEDARARASEAVATLHEQLSRRADVVRTPPGVPR